MGAIQRVLADTADAEIWLEELRLSIESELERHLQGRVESAPHVASALYLRAQREKHNSDGLD